MATGASPPPASHDGGMHSGKCLRLDTREDLYEHHLPALEGVKHFITYDRSSVHKAPQAPPTSASLRTPSTRATCTGSPPSYTQQHQRTTSKKTDAQYADLPPLQQQDDDDEDYEDNRSLSRYSAETNKWLLFAGVFALITTLFIVNFSTLPHQAHSKRRTQELLSHLSQISRQLEAAPILDEAATSFSAMLSSLGLSEYTDPPSPTLAMEIRDEWAPALWYTSLMVTLMGTILILTIKHWLMSCTFATWALCDPDIKDDELEGNERSGPASWQEGGKSESEKEKELEKELRKEYAMMKKHKETLRKTRKETLKKTERVKPVIPFLMYSALGMFVCGVAAKLGSLLWIGHA